MFQDIKYGLCKIFRNVLSFLGLCTKCLKISATMTSKINCNKCNNVFKHDFATRTFVIYCFQTIMKLKCKLVFLSVSMRMKMNKLYNNSSLHKYYSKKKLHQSGINQQREAQYGEPVIYFDACTICIRTTRFKNLPQLKYNFV